VLLVQSRHRRLRRNDGRLGDAIRIIIEEKRAHTLIPGLVSTDANGYKSGAYGAFTRLSSMP
jgi:hypothetical protein